MRLQNFTTGKIFGATIVAIIVTIAYGVSLSRPGAGFNEGGIGTITSVVLLALTSAASFQIHSIRRRDMLDASARDPVVWIIIGAGFAFLALDEAFMIHENLDRLIHKVGGITQTSLTDRIDDFLILLYGIIGVATLLRYKSEIMRIPRFVTFLKLGFALMVLQVALDTLANGNEINSLLNLFLDLPADVPKLRKIFEDSVKLLAEATLLAGLTHALRFVSSFDATSSDAPG